MTREDLGFLLSLLGVTCERSRTHTTQLERREEEEEDEEDEEEEEDWICAKLGELVLHLEYFDLVSGFEDWLSRASYLIGILSVRVAAVSAQSNLGR